MTTDQRIKICFLMQSFETGGAERVGVNILNHIDTQNFSIELLVIGTDEGALKKEMQRHFKTTCLHKRRAVYAIFAIIFSIWKQKPDVLFVNMSHLNILVSMIRLLLPRKLVIVARETNLVSSNYNDYACPFAWSLLYKLFYRHLDHVICQSEAMLNDLVGKFRLPVQNASIINNPIDIELIRQKVIRVPKPQFNALQVNFVAIGNFYPRKNFDGLLRALALCDRKNIVVNILGDGPERKRLEDLIKELGLSKQIKLPGQVVNPYPFIVKADALVLSSFYEGLPNVILESLALQTPVIATPAGGVCKELLADRVGCVLAKDVSDRAIAEAISYWIESAPHIIDEDAVKLFDAPMIVKRYESIFASVVP